MGPVGGGVRGGVGQKAGEWEHGPEGSRRSWKGGGRSERSGRSGRRARACTGAL